MKKVKPFWVVLYATNAFTEKGATVSHCSTLEKAQKALQMLFDAAAKDEKNEAARIRKDMKSYSDDEMRESMEQLARDHHVQAKLLQSFDPKSPEFDGGWFMWGEFKAAKIEKVEVFDQFDGIDL